MCFSDDVAIVHGYIGQVYLQPKEWKYHLDAKGLFYGVDEVIGNQIYAPTEQTYCIEFAMKNGLNFGYRLFRYTSGLVFIFIIKHGTE